MEFRKICRDIAFSEDNPIARLELLKIISSAEKLYYNDTPTTRKEFLQVITKNGYVTFFDVINKYSITLKLPEFSTFFVKFLKNKIKF
jgi:hypothetical protein